jgi:hypothetical protein
VLQADQRIASPPVTTLVVILLVLAAGAALVAQLAWWLSSRPERERVPPPLVYPIHPHFARRAEQPAAELPAAATARRSAGATSEATAAATTAATTEPSTVPSPSSDTSPVEPAPLETVQFARPTEEAVQLLPARLEVVSGMTPQQVIRFVRVPGQPAEMILGREAASSPQQVTLTSSTVSRRHARVTYDDGRWLVTNLSRTNPVVVNDHALAEFEGPRPLLDGDRIELGDVVLRFCTS